uniref:Discoidin, CUB and LCCL domain containing 2 n=1 Tax=Cyprinodon variegatus TaxID=28743 RepID=A0A3Q2D173_CYPVA
MVGRGPAGAAVLLLSLLIVLGCRGQKDGCGPSVLGPSSGTLSSLGYPRTYPNNTVCEWEITVPRGKRIHFRFAVLDIQDSDCQVNYLRLYNGIGQERREIKYCGLDQKVDELIESSGNQVTVQFMSGTHRTGRGFYLSYSTTEHPDLITCLDKGSDFPEAEFKYCPAGCLTSTEKISGTIPNGYRELQSSPLCVAAVHAGVVSNAVGGRIHVVSSKGIPHYEGTLANNVTSTCYGTLGLESGGVADTQLSSSSVWDWNTTAGQPRVWRESGARLKKAGLPWAPSHSDQQQWLQVDLKREKRITIITTGSNLSEYRYFVSAYQVLYSKDGKIFQGNTNYADKVRNNFIPPIEARFVRIKPSSWHQRIALKLELLGCQVPEKSAEGTYDIPYWDRTWWKGMKQLLPSKMVETEDSVRYSTPEVSRLPGRGAVPGLHAEPAYAQPLVSGVTTLGPRSTFKPDEGPEPGYSDPDLYDAPIPPNVYHPYAEPLPSSGSEYATPIVVDMGCHLPSTVLNFVSSGPSSKLAWTDGGQSGGSVYDTPKNANGQTTPTQDLTYQVP